MIDSSRRRARPPSDGQICSLLAVDIAAFTSPDRDDDIRRHLHRRLYEMLAAAFAQAGMEWGDCWHEDRGDGTLVVIPPGIAVRTVLYPLLDRLRDLIRLHNHASKPAARIQLRVAVHIGSVDHDGEGFVSSEINQLFRLLDAPPLKRALAASTAELGLIVSEYVYDSVVRRHPTLISPSAFRQIRFQVKYTRAKAWIYLPGLAELTAVPADTDDGTGQSPGWVSRPRAECASASC
jgi:class 3 adenylate cyclase